MPSVLRLFDRFYVACSSMYPTQQGLVLGLRLWRSTTFLFYRSFQVHLEREDSSKGIDACSSTDSTIDWWSTQLACQSSSKKRSTIAENKSPVAKHATFVIGSQPICDSIPSIGIISDSSSIEQPTEDETRPIGSSIEPTNWQQKLHAVTSRGRLRRLRKSSGHAGIEPSNSAPRIPSTTIFAKIGKNSKTKGRAPNAG